MSTDEGQAAGDDRDEWATAVLDLLGSLSREDVPALEYVLIDCLATWLFSDANPGENYDEHLAAQVVSVLFTAMAHAHEVEPADAPTDDGPVGVSRGAVANGAYELAECRDITVLITRAMPAVIGELEKFAGDPARQLHSAYYYLLLAVATGTGELGDPQVAEGILTSFMAWDGLFASGAVSRLALRE